MRVVSLIFLLLIGGGLAFVFIHEPTRTWVFKQGGEAAFLAEGYTFAKSPREAMDFFEKAIKARNYKAAARYCSDDYAKQLVKAHSAGVAVGNKLDRLSSILDEKQLRTNAAADLVNGMDPFPRTFKFKDVKEDKKKADVADGQFEFVKPKAPIENSRDLSPEDRSHLDQKLYLQWVLMPSDIFAQHLVIKKDKDKEIWKIQFTPRDEALIDHFIDRHKPYAAAYGQYIDELLREAKLPANAGHDLLTLLIAAK